MTRRTRRNLSNPRIKRIVKKEILTSQNQISFAVNSPFNILFKRTILSIFVVFVLLWGYSLLKDSELVQFDSFVENITGDQSAPGTPKIQSESNTENKNLAEKGASDVKKDEKAAIEPVSRKLQVEVLNGCGADGIASRVTRYLRDNKIDVVNIGNYRSFDIKETVLWERVDKNEPAQRIAQLLGLTNDNIASKIDPNLQLDVTVILGADYKTLTPFKN